ncbi:MAG: asparagine--tRNA ligase [Patescibacteria group bacterium]|jgi:asparaginyl-tRNA synthetase
MDYILSKDLKAHLNKEVLLKGWVYNFRSSGKLFFLQFRDGYGTLQAIANKDQVPEGLKLETSCEIVGTVSKHPKKEEYELHVKEFKVIQIPKQDYPISKKDHGPEFLLDNRHLWLRSSKQWAVMRVRDTIIRAVYDFFHEQGFIKIDSPILTPNACEGTTTLFPVEYFDLGKAYLSQSGQLYLEAAVMSLGKVYDFGPVFRAEKSKTRKHLTEFWMMDAEMAFYEHKENMKVQEDMVCYIIKKVLAENKIELNILERKIEDLEKIKAPFYHIDHKKACEKLGADPSDDFGAEDELKLANSYDKPVFVEKYPAKVKAFYMKRDPQDESRVLCNDLLAPGLGEIIGGSQREDDYDKLLARIKEQNLPEKDFQWYLDLRQYGSVPHAGFGLGLERCVQWLTGIAHIRESIPFPRLINRLKP